MRLIGIDGGHTIYELGPVSDVVLFFNCLDFFAKKAHPEKDWSVLTDRLYRHYLRMADLELAGELMELVERCLPLWIPHLLSGIPVCCRSTKKHGSMQVRAIWERFLLNILTYL